MKLLTSVGTSIFRNYIKENKGALTDKEISILESSTRFCSDKFDQKQAEKTVEKIVLWATNRDSASAEIKSTICIQNRYGNCEEVHLISSDTVSGAIAALAVEGTLKTQGFNAVFDPRLDVIKGLQVNNAKLFESEGIYNLAKRCDTFGVNYGLDSADVAYNFTGGFKSVIPYMSILAQLNNVPMYYIFEYTDELIEISRAPLTFDYGFFAEFQHIIEKLNDGIYEDEWMQIKKEYGLEYRLDQFKACYYFSNGIAELNSLGRIMFEKYLNCYNVLVHKQCAYFKDDINTKKQIDSATRKLCYLIEEKIKDTNSLDEVFNDDKIKHDIIKTRHYVFTYSGTDNTQLRMLYLCEKLGDNFRLKIYDYQIKRTGEPKSYISYFENVVKSWNHSDSSFVQRNMSKG